MMATKFPSGQSIGAAINGIYETHLPVRDLRRSVAFYRDQLGLEFAKEFSERRVVFFWVGTKAEGMLGLWETGTAPLQMKLHFAFRAPMAMVVSSCELLREAGIQPLGFNGEPVSEPVVLGWMPAISVYFKDPDGHSLEILSALDAAPDAEFGVGPYSAWVAKHG
ncbi:MULTISPECIES: VOC family protein [unclassified Sinorhizobium]|uniref:VOC family protein n=1 Tax=unclassified Sinorhizobium TaxID=2613772 RepID=UPI0024C241B8|nr:MULTISPECIES: VOC family protein [unclassified Sinorhizobium]MDK1374265.1 VOC family protein [Sinorhizobium sp. 6-70]MDK1479408.1 VOC family protein [Sinorhizobium sp. 6-117]